ncbi:MAG TPA: hypothetical protein VN632_08840 [Stellaceae bacterium]|nr:hypothetical protein [Stellaceae bacterium]
MSDWQLDGLPGDVRQEAENAAQREGLPLHRWLGKLIRETADDEGVSASRELTRGYANDTAPIGANGFGNGHRHQPVVPPRPAVDPIRMTPQAPPRPAAAPMVARQTEPPRQPNRAPPAAPTMPPAPPVAPPQSAVKLSPLSTAPSPAPAGTPRGMPPAAATSPAPMASRFAAEPRPSARPEPAPIPAPSLTHAAGERSDDRLGALGKMVQSLRRNELSPIGEARLFLKLMTEHMANVGDISAVTGRTKDQISRSLRLLGLSDRLRDLIDRGALSREQAFALLDADDPDAASPVVPPSGSRA